MKAVILDAETMGRDIDFAPIENVCDLAVFNNTKKEEIAQRINDAEIVILNKVVLDKAALSCAKKLRLICVFAIGYNNIDINYCRENNISVRNTPGYCVQSVCQHTFALLFALIENLRYYDDFVKSGLYSKSGAANHLAKPFFELDGKNWGIIGLGAIGRQVGFAARAFGANVCYSSLSGAEREEPFLRVPLERLLKESDIISLSTPLNEKSQGLIGKNALALMKKSAVLINVSRGAVTDEAALAQAIDEGIIAGAGIDVYSSEPPEKSSLLMNVKKSDRVVFTPHIAWASVEARRRCISMTAQNITSYLNGEKGNDVCR